MFTDAQWKILSHHLNKAKDISDQNREEHRRAYLRGKVEGIESVLRILLVFSGEEQEKRVKKLEKEEK